MFSAGQPEFGILLLISLAILIPLVIWLYCVIDIIKSEFTGNNKIIYLLLVILVPLLGVLVYAFYGKNQKIKALQQAEPNDAQTVK